jgi:peptide/nickel transport system substrate-binding protein
MGNRFGLKDLALVVLLLAVGVSVWLGMVQRDRQFRQLRDLGQKVAELDREVGKLRAALAATPSAPPGAAARDESWARPGVPVQWQPPWTFASDPRGMAGYAAGGEACDLLEQRSQSITPYLNPNAANRRVVDQVMQTLATYDPETLELRGVLAEAWQFDPKGLWLRVKINPRACFSDGSPVTAEDLRWSLEEYAKRTELELGITADMETLTGVRVVAPQVAEFTFARPFFSNLFRALTMYILPADYYRGFTTEELKSATGLLMGSGPFRLAVLKPDQQWTPNEDVVLVRNERYWGDRPALDGLRFRLAPDPAARMTAYLNGECHIFLPTSLQFEAMGKDPARAPDTQLLKWENMRSAFQGIAWQCGDRKGAPSVFRDARVRRAMTHLVDRDLLIREVFRGVGTPISQPTNVLSRQFDPTIKPRSCSEDAARALLAEAGWTPRGEGGRLVDAQGREFRFTLTLPEMGDVDDQIAAHVRARCAAVGIEMLAESVDMPTLESKGREHNFDAMFCTWFPTDAENDLWSLFHTKAIGVAKNWGQWSNPEADQRLERAQETIDDAARMEAWHGFMRVVFEDEPYTWIRAAPWVRAVSRKLENVRPYKTGLEPREWFVKSGSPG